MKIQSTKDYSKFRFITWNRDVHPKNLNELKKKMIVRNLTKDFPVIINKRWEVLDGQHRVKVAKILGIPVYYKFSAGMTSHDISFVQTNSRWIPMDYVKFWKVKNNRNFILFDKFLNKYGIGVGPALESLGLRQQQKNLIHEGQLKFNESDFQDACRLFDRIFEFKEQFPAYKNRSFLRAMAAIMSFKQYDHKHMKSKLEYLKFTRCPDTNSYIDMIEEIYNHRTRNKIYFSHLIKTKRGQNGNSKGK